MASGSRLSQAICDAVDGYVVPANYNSPAQIVVSGEMAAVDAVMAVCKEQKIRAMKLPVSAPFHCAMMAPAAEEVRAALEGIEIGQPRVPVYLNVNAEPLESGKEVAGWLVEQTKSPVLWRQTLENMARDGMSTFVECGPGATLSGFVKKTLSDAQVLIFG